MIMKMLLIATALGGALVFATAPKWKEAAQPAAAPQPPPAIVREADKLPVATPVLKAATPLEVRIVNEPQGRLQKVAGGNPALMGTEQAHKSTSKNIQDQWGWKDRK